MPELTKEIVESKRVEYANNKQQAQIDLNNAQYRVALFQGAIEDCDFWLSQIAKPNDQTPS